MELRKAFGLAMRQLRKSRGLTQEAFSSLSSRTYLSTLERGIKAPTLDKIDDLARTMGVHPLTLMAGCYLVYESEPKLNELLNLVRTELLQAEFLDGGLKS